MRKRNEKTVLCIPEFTDCILPHDPFQKQNIEHNNVLQIILMVSAVWVNSQLHYLPLDYFFSIQFPPPLGPLQRIHSCLQRRWGSWGFALNCLISETDCLRLDLSVLHGLESWAPQRKRWSATQERIKINMFDKYLYRYLKKFEW